MPVTARTLRIIHCPMVVGGNAPNLARFERRLGLDSKAIVLSQTYFNYPVDQVLYTGSHPLGREWARWRLLLKVMKSADVVHFNFGRPILYWGISTPPPKRLPAAVAYYLFKLYARFWEFKDLALLKRMGKTIVVTYQGSDARQGDYCRKHFNIHPAGEDEHLTPSSDQLKRKAIRVMDKYADQIYSLNPDLLHVLPKRAQFMPYAHIDLEDWKTAPSFSNPDRPVVLHAPSQRGVKGTRFILDAVSRLKDEGVDFEFVLVEKLSRQEARKLYERADLLIDQLLCGWYGGLAVELMALGKPVICYIRENDLQFIPKSMKKALPIINAKPDNIYDVLKVWLMDRSKELPKLGVKSRAYVEQWHHPAKITAQLQKRYQELVL